SAEVNDFTNSKPDLPDKSFKSLEFFSHVGMATSSAFMLGHPFHPDCVIPSD
ncbi:hypothetical protein CDAR_14971, partial [Caerostris darwini]